MERDLQKENLILKNTIKELQLSIKTLLAKQSPSQPFSHYTPQNKDILPSNDKTCHSLIQYSPIHTYESLQEETFSLETQQKSYLSEIPETQSVQNPNQTQPPTIPVDYVKFDVDDRLDSQSHMANLQISKDLQLQELKYKKSIDPSTQIQQLKAKPVYNSAIKQKNICQECITRMHQMHQMEFLKNKYHREYISLRTELEKLKSQLNEHESHQTPRSSINLIEFYGDHTNQQKSQKSSFSFENIQNALLSERFALEIQQCIKLIDKLLPLDRKFIQLSSGDFKLLMELQMKIEKLKSHLGLDTEPKYLDDLFNELQKSQTTIKKIHEKYKKLIEKISKSHKQKSKKAKDQFNEVSNKFVGILVNLSDEKSKNSKLKTQIAQLRAQIALQQLKQPKTISLTSSHQIKPSSAKQNIKDSMSQEKVSKKQKDLHETSSSQCEKASALSDTKLEKQLEKIQTKLKNTEKYSKSLQKMIKQQKSQILSMKKKYLNDFNQFMNSIIFQKHSKLRSITQQTDLIQSTDLQKQVHISQDQLKIITQLSTKKLIQEIGTLVYEIFLFTSWQNDDGENIFLPQNEAEILEMLRHIKKFAHKFDEWQKEKEKEVIGFQKNFLQLLKFFIDCYKVSEQKLLEEISKIKDNEPLAVYIKRYYQKAVELSDSDERDSNSFTFGQKSQSCKDSEEP